jgi:hypothetical protein
MVSTTHGFIKEKKYKTAQWVGYAFTDKKYYNMVLESHLVVKFYTKAPPSSKF